MSALHRLASLLCVAVLAGCTSEGLTGVSGVDGRDPAESAGELPGLAGAILAKVTGSGHVIRNLGAGDELTTFSYSAIQEEDGGKGQWQYNFRAADFAMHGDVTCVGTAANQGWIGGVITHVTSSDPADQSFVGEEVWWQVEDNGESANDPPDRTTSLLFRRLRPTLTAQEWCDTQPNFSVLMRPVVHGNIQVD